MSMRASRSALGVLGFLLLAASPPATPPRSPVVIRNGVNKVDFVGDGSHGLIVQGHQKNEDGRSSEIVSFYVLTGGRWNLVYVGLTPATEAAYVSILRDGDCVIDDVRLLPGSTVQPATLILAEADQKEVRFSYYTLKSSPEENSQMSRFYFERTHSELAKKPYCDVEEAFKEELQY
jgi:carbapenem resistance CarG-like protein